jgi:hypothetical protein
MTRRDPLETGCWYRFEGFSPSRKGRPVQVLQCEGNAVLGRFANGSEQLIMCAQIGRKVADAKPGVTEPCLVCGGAQTVPVIQAVGDRSWAGKRVGVKPCPNCHGSIDHRSAAQSRRAR